MIEGIIFNIVAFFLFIFLFFRMIQKNDTNYIYVLIGEALGIAIEFFGLITQKQATAFMIIIKYIFAIVIPIAIIIIEKSFMSLTELLLLSICKIYKNKNNLEGAKKNLLKLIEKVPDSYYAHKELAEIYEDEKQYEIAAEEYIRTANIKPKEYAIQYKIAKMFNECNKKDQAADILQGLLKKKPDWQEATLLLGDIYQEQEKFKEAVNIYMDAIKYNSDNYDLYYNLGIVYTMLNDFKSAKEYYEKAAQLNSLLYHAKYSLGQISLIFDELNEAEQYFIECLEDENLEEDAYYYLAYISMLKGEEDKAINYLNVAVSENPETYERIKKEIIFKLIFVKIEKPTKNLTPNKKMNKKELTQKEKMIIKHLRHTYELVGNLNHNDIKAMKIIQSKRQEEIDKKKEMNNLEYDK